MATLQEYMARRNMVQRSGTYGAATAGSQGKYWWIREREDEDVLTAARRAGLYGNDLKQQAQPARSDAGFLEKSWETGVDVVGNILSGAAKSLEGVFDLGLGAIGAVGGIFDKSVRDEMRRWVEYDFTGENISKHFDRWSDDSIMNDSKAGRIAEGVFSGVGQLLPTVAISLATGGAATPAMLALGASAAGNATEEAWGDGADYYRGLGYGVVSGGVEVATEKLFGGLGGLMGGGMLDNVTRSIAKTGAARVVKEMAGEAAEEALAEVVNPLARTIYKGRDALSDYGSADYWGGVGEAALVGGLTSAAYGGTVGRALKTSGKYADVQAVKEEIEAIGKKRNNLYINDKLTDAQEEALQKSEVANYRVLERLLQRSSDKKRADLIKRGNLSRAFDESGTLRTDFLRSLGERVMDGQTDTPGANEAQGAKSTAVDRRYVSPSLYYKTDVIERDLEAIAKDAGQEVGSIRVFSGDLDADEQAAYKKLKQVETSLSEKSGGRLQMVLVEPNSAFRGAQRKGGNTIYISKETLKNGSWSRILTEEAVHFTQGTQEYAQLARFVAEDEDLLARVSEELTKEGNTYGFTEEDMEAFALAQNAEAEAELTERQRAFGNELGAHMAAEVLDNEVVIDRLVGEQSSLAEKILLKIKDVGRAFSRMTDKDARAQYDRVKRAEGLYYAAIERRGWKVVNGAIEEKEQTYFHFETNASDDNTLTPVGEVTAFIQSVHSMKDKSLVSKRVQKLGTVSQTHADIIKREINLDVSGFEIWIDGSSVTHIEERHGKNGKADQSMQDINDVARVADVVNHADDGSVLFDENGELSRDSVYRNSDQSHALVMKFYKQESDGLYYVVEAVPDTESKKLFVKSAYKQKKSGIDQEVRMNKKSLHQTPEAVLDNYATNNSIPQNSDLSTGKTNFNRKEAANQQTSGDIGSETPKKKSKTKAEIQKENVQLKKEVKEQKARADERDDRLKLGEQIGKKVGEMATARQGKFMAAAEYKSDILRTSIESLSQINYGKTVSGSVRGIIKKLAEWYAPDNPLLVQEFEYKDEIAIQMQEIALGEEGTELSFGEMRMLDNILGHMLFMEKHYQKIRKGDQMVDAMDYAKKYVEKLKAAGKDVTGFVRVMLRSKYMRQFGDPLALVKAADAYDPEGFFTETYREFRQAAVDMSVREIELMEDWRSFHGKHKGFDKRMIKETVEFRGQDMRLGEAISLYMTLQRKQAQRGLVESYYVTVDDKGNKTNVKGFEPRKTGGKNKLTDAEIATICKEGQAALWDKFDDVTHEYIKMIEDTFGEMRSIKQATDMEMQGYTVVSDRGYYYPIRRDQVAKEVKERKFEVDRVSHLTINRATVEGANAGLLIEPVEVVFRRHVKSISLYSCFSVPMENYNRLVNLDTGGNVKDPVSVKRLAENTAEMKEMLEYMDKLAKDIQGSVDKGNGEQRLMRDTAEYLRGAYAKFQLGLNLKTVATQLSSLFAASSRLDYASLLNGFSVDAKDVDKYCRLAEVRNTENSAALAAGVLETTGKIGDALMFGIGKMDRLVIKRLYAACQVQVAKEQKLKLGSEENKIAAGELLQEVILDTQQNSLATERSDAMRSSDTLWRSLTMFSADSMKVFGRFSEAVGEVSVLDRKLKNAQTDSERRAIAAQIKEAKGHLTRSAGALVASAAFMAVIAQLFRSLYAKDDDKELEEIASHVALDAMGNMVGGLPIINDALSFIIDGYEVDNFIFATFNDVLKAGTEAFSLASDAIGGKEVEPQQLARTTRDTVYAMAQMFGIPIRNVYNTVTGLSSRFSDQAKYWNENLFYTRPYASDLAAAIEADDEGMIAMIASMMVEEKVGGVDAELSAGLRELVEKGYSVLPRVLGDTITYDGEEVELTRRQRERFKAVYAIAQEQIGSMMKLRQYKEASEEVRAKAIKMVWDAYWDLAVDDVLGVDSSEKNVLFAEAIDMDKLALIVATAREIKADVNEAGKAISGTRLAKIEAYIEKLNLKAAQKYMIMGYLGYKNKNGEDKVRAYVGGLSKLSKAEKEALMEYAGYGG